MIAEIRCPSISDSATTSSTITTSQFMNMSTVNLKDDPGSLIKCLAVAGELFRDLRITKLTPPLMTLVESLLLPCIQNENPYVRDMSVFSLGLACLLDVSLARRHILLFIQVIQVDHENVQATSLKVVFDMLHLYGLEAFNLELKPSEEKEEEKEEGKEHEM
uniref:Nuclear condensin complex subunit 3 C-terminal domain-containing protein n=1 Tax=Amphimedon queenslandica TaxID=400682 RepID=A0A1X7SQ01_AMPQE